MPGAPCLDFATWETTNLMQLCSSHTNSGCPMFRVVSKFN